MKHREKSTLETIKHLRNLLDELYDLKEKINATFSIQILSYFLYNFCESIFFAFLNIMIFQTNDHFPELDQHDLVIFFATFGFMYKSFILGFIGSYIYNNAKRIGVIVNRLYNKTEDEKVQQQARARKFEKHRFCHFNF